MKAAILCRGQSLCATYMGIAGYDHVIAVNSTVAAYPTTHWVFTDPQVFHENIPIGMPILCVHQGMQQVLGMERSEWYSKRFHQHERIWFQNMAHLVPEELDCGKRSWMGWSQEAALVLCHTLGAKEVDVYGADWTNAPTFDGVKHKRDQHDDARWNDERPAWDTVTAYLSDRGMKITRISPN